MIKRGFDLIVASLALVIVSPLLALIALAIIVESRGPILHRATRIGRDQKPFVLLKLRSMRVDAATTGPGITASGDNRVTRVGRVLRRFKLDELPQLWNVVRGDMSIVGPRPEDPRYLANYSPQQLTLMRWRPGITSPASVTYRDEERVLTDAVAHGVDLETAYLDVQAAKLGIELDYFPKSTLRSDIGWIFRTVAAIAH